MPKSDGLLSPGEVLWTFRANGPIACRPAVNEVPATGIAHVYATLTSLALFTFQIFQMTPICLPVLHYYIYGIRRAHPNHLGILDQMMACYMQ